MGVGQVVDCLYALVSSSANCSDLPPSQGHCRLHLASPPAGAEMKDELSRKRLGRYHPPDEAPLLVACGGSLQGGVQLPQCGTHALVWSSHIELWLVCMTNKTSKIKLVHDSSRAFPVVGTMEAHQSSLDC